MIHSRTRLKMCGMTRIEDINHAISLGVDAIGLIFYQGSSRYVSIERAKKLLHKIPAFVDVVAVFVQPEESFVRQILIDLPIQWLQFHGDESPMFCEQFARPYIKAISAISDDVISRAAEQYNSATALLLDTPSTTSRGGCGKAFDWTIIPDNLKMPIILAGGLDALNVQSAVLSCAPYGVDVCSGIESSAGIKDLEKMRQFVEALWGKE